MATDKKPLTTFFPIPFDVVAGECYRWCGCGKTTTEPLCDRQACSECVIYRAIVTENVLFCGCKKTKEPPFCDGSHSEAL